MAVKRSFSGAGNPQILKYHNMGIGIFLAKHSVLGFNFILWCCWVLGVVGYIVFGK